MGSQSPRVPVAMTAPPRGIRFSLAHIEARGANKILLAGCLMHTHPLFLFLHMCSWLRGSMLANEYIFALTEKGEA